MVLTTLLLTISSQPKTPSPLPSPNKLAAAIPHPCPRHIPPAPVSLSIDLLHQCFPLRHHWLDTAHFERQSCVRDSSRTSLPGQNTPTGMRTSSLDNPIYGHEQTSQVMCVTHHAPLYLPGHLYQHQILRPHCRQSHTQARNLLRLTRVEANVDS